MDWRCLQTTCVGSLRKKMVEKILSAQSDLKGNFLNGQRDVQQIGEYIHQSKRLDNLETLPFPLPPQSLFIIFDSGF